MAASTASAYSAQPAPSSPAGRRTPIASWPIASSSPVTRWNIHGSPPAPGIRTYVVTPLWTLFVEPNHRLRRARHCVSVGQAENPANCVKTHQTGIAVELPGCEFKPGHRADDLREVSVDVVHLLRIRIVVVFGQDTE